MLDGGRQDVLGVVLHDRMSLKFPSDQFEFAGVIPE